MVLHLKYTPSQKDTIQRIAVCGGSGSFLLGAAKAAGADVLITSDYKYHQFFDADGTISILDISDILRASNLQLT